MTQSRRRFLQTTALAGAALALPRLGRAGEPPAKLKVLILGGTGFLGPATVEAARARGHTLTLFNRGRTEKRKGGMFPDIEKLYGNRDPEKRADDKDDASPKGLAQLDEAIKAGRKWDAVVDTSGYYPRIVRASAELLAPAARQYIFISSVSVYADNSKPGADETAPLATLTDTTVETMGGNYENYGGLKALCEQAADKAMPGRVANVRPGLIVGPDDPTGRYTYWPVRVDKGGEVLCPGTPDDPAQMVDVRDLGEWIVLLIENNKAGAFDALGPQPGKATGMTMGDVIRGCQKAGSTPAQLTWASAEFLEKEGVLAWRDMPLWVAPAGDSAGFHLRDCSRAVKAGLKFRSPEVTARDTLAWWKGLPEGDARRKLAGLSDEREAAVLKKWHEKG